MIRNLKHIIDNITELDPRVGSARMRSVGVRVEGVATSLNFMALTDTRMVAALAMS